MTDRPADAVTLVWGDDAFLVREAALEALGPDRPQVFDAADWRPGAVADLATPSLFGEERSLLITGAQDLPEDGLAEVARHAEDPPPGTRLALAAVVTARAKAPPKKLGAAVGKGAAVRRVVVERRDLPGWVRDRARRYGVRPTGPGAVALIETVGEDPAILDQALRQVAAVAPPDGLTPQAVRAQFRGFGERRVWEVCDAAFTGDAATALRSLAGMLEAREEPLMVLGGIASRLRDLIRVRSLPPGMPPAEVARAAGLRFDWQARRYMGQARRYGEEELAGLHHDVVEADRTLKQGGSGDVVLSMLVSRIAGGAGAPAPGDRIRARRAER
jgi:DNA polymerase III subunit delta